MKSCDPQLASPGVMTTALLKVKPRTEHNTSNIADSRKYIMAAENTMPPTFIRLLGQSSN